MLSPPIRVQNKKETKELQNVSYSDKTPNMQNFYDDVVAEDEVVAEELPTEEEALVTDAGLLDFLYKKSDCKHEFKAVNASGGYLNVDGIGVYGHCENNAWCLYKSGVDAYDIVVENGSKSAIKRVVIYFYESITEAEAAGLFYNLPFSVTMSSYNQTDKCAVFTGDFGPSTTFSVVNDVNVHVLKVEVYTEHVDENKDGICDLCKYDTYNYTQRLAYNVGKTVGFFSKLDKVNERITAIKVGSVIDAVLNSFSSLFRGTV